MFRKYLRAIFHRLADVFHIGISTALAGQDQDLLHSGFCDHLHFMLHLFHGGELLAADLIIAVEAAVYTVNSDSNWQYNEA